MTRLALLVGDGDIARSAVEAVRADTQIVPTVLSMTGTRDDVDGKIDIGEPLELVNQLRSLKIDTVCAVGSVDLDAPRRKKIAQFAVQHAVGAVDPSDMGMELAFRTIAKEARAKIVGVHELCPVLLAGVGRVAGPELSIPAFQLDQMVRTARAIARTDLGQSMVFEFMRPVAAEDALGTDSLIERAGNIAKTHHLDPTKLTLVKVAKPQQSGIGDLPTIGPRTVENCASSGISNIIVESDKCLIAARGEFEEVAMRANIAVFGWG